MTASQLGKADGDVQGWLPNPKSATDCFIRQVAAGAVSESDRNAFVVAYDKALLATLIAAGRR